MIESSQDVEREYMLLETITVVIDQVHKHILHTKIIGKNLESKMHHKETTSFNTAR